MKRYFFHLAYNGIDYRGWQRQPDTLNIQGTIEAALSKIFKRDVFITGCGRTDAKVHASQYFFHVDLKETWDYDLIERLNNNLPKHIIIYDITPVEDNAHARRDAYSRTYQYYFHTEQNPFNQNTSAYYPMQSIDLNAMTKACELLTTHNDYKLLCKTPEKMESTLCNISAADIYVNKNQKLFCFQIKANRFLRGMVRALVHELLEISQGTSVDKRLIPFLKNLPTTEELNFAHPQGLYLSEIKYEYLSKKNKAAFQKPSKSYFTYHFNTMNFTIHHIDKTGKISEKTYSQIGPRHNGITIDISFSKYNGPLDLPQTIKKTYWYSYISSVQSLNKKNYAFINISYGAKIKQKTLEDIISIVEKHL